MARTPRDTRWSNSNKLRLGAWLALAAVLPAACSSEDDGGGGPPPVPEVPTATLEVELTFPDSRMHSAVASLHLWVIQLKPGSDLTCSALVGALKDPYDLSGRRVADVVSTDVDAPIVAENVEVGPALVYVEAVDFSGQPELAGCASTTIAEPSTSETVALDQAGVSDCADPETEDGARCDDGVFCTIGETCEDGECQGGVPRDCTHMADQCNAEACDETLGCVASALADTTPCDDNLFCTENDVCTDGVCGGSARNCAAGLAQCEIAIGCDESNDECLSTTAPIGTACDDGLFCTEDDQCYGASGCLGTTRVCPGDQCNAGTCDETSGMCATTPTALAACDDADLCTVADSCDASGTCAGTPVDCSYLSDPATCMVGQCNTSTGACQAMPATVGSACDDGDACTSDDTCTGSGCAGTPIDCSPLTDVNACLVGQCNASTGTCQAVAAEDSTPCDDQDDLTTNDMCTGGVCSGI